MEALIDLGLVKNIAVSNMSIAKLKGVLERCTIKPVANQIELHPTFQQQELFDFMVKNDVFPIGYSPVGSPNRPERDRTSEDACDIEEPIVKKIAERLNIHPAQVCLKWAVQRGSAPIPMSANPKNIVGNLKAITKEAEPLTPEEMIEMKTAEHNSRLIKGQVFLWPEAAGWEALWE